MHNAVVGIHSFPACRSSLKRNRVEIMPLSSLVVCLGKALNGVHLSLRG